MIEAVTGAIQEWGSRAMMALAVAVLAIAGVTVAVAEQHDDGGEVHVPDENGENGENHEGDEIDDDADEVEADAGHSGTVAALKAEAQGDAANFGQSQRERAQGDDEQVHPSDFGQAVAAAARERGEGDDDDEADETEQLGTTGAEEARERGGPPAHAGARGRPDHAGSSGPPPHANNDK